MISSMILTVVVLMGWPCRGSPILQINSTVICGRSIFIRCIVERSASDITLGRPDNISVLSCSDSLHCRQQFPGYLHDRHTSNGTVLVAAVMAASSLDNGTWTCRYGSKKSAAVTTVTELATGCLNACKPLSPIDLQPYGSETPRSLPELQIESPAGRYSSIYIRCIVENSSRVIDVAHPGSSTVLHCDENPLNCKQNFPGYIQDKYKSNRTMIVVAVMAVDDVDNGTWTCRHGHETSEATLIITEPDCQVEISRHTNPSETKESTNSEPNNLYIILVIGAIILVILFALILFEIKKTRSSGNATKVK